MKNKLSNSSTNTYLQCSEKYNLHYNARIRSKKTTSALLFGNAIDGALNTLLETRSITIAKEKFKQLWSNVEINGEKIVLPDRNDLVTYSKADSEFGPPWQSLFTRGNMMIDAYEKDILPHIKEVIAVQKREVLTNDEGDELTYILDLIVRWSDGKIYLMDHKTSSVPYKKDSAGQSQQLVLYYSAEQDNYKLDGVGFIVLYKKPVKTVTKTCKECGNVTIRKVKTCDVPFLKGRCNGEFEESTTYSIKTEVILNSVSDEMIDKVYETFDSTNVNIKNGVFEKNYNACWSYGQPCPYYNLCREGSMEGLVVLEKKKNV